MWVQSLGFPEAELLTRLANDVSVTHPQTSIFRFPRFSTGLATMGERIFVLADLPALRVFELDTGGHVRRTYGTSEAVYGRHYHALAVTTRGQALEFFSIATDVGSEQRIVVYSQ